MRVRRARICQKSLRLTGNPDYYDDLLEFAGREMKFLGAMNVYVPGYVVIKVSRKISKEWTDGCKSMIKEEGNYCV